MASSVAKRLIGETEETPSPDSIASDWFFGLNDEVRRILADGSVDNIELQAAALISGDRVLSWEESQSSDEGDLFWEVVHEAGKPITAYSIYAHRLDSGADHISDHKTHEEAVTEGKAIAALLGVELHDLSPSQSS